MTCEHSALYFCELCADSRECVACKIARESGDKAAWLAMEERILAQRAEIEKLNKRIIELDLNCAERCLDLDELRSEIAALREAVRYAYQNYMDLCEDWGEGAEWLDRPAVRRALEETP